MHGSYRFHLGNNETVRNYFMNSKKCMNLTVEQMKIKIYQIKIELISSLRSVALQRIPFTVKATRYDDTSDIERIST